jgi:hypothetical protein
MYQDPIEVKTGIPHQHLYSWKQNWEYDPIWRTWNSQIHCYPFGATLQSSSLPHQIISMPWLSISIGFWCFVSQFPFQDISTFVVSFIFTATSTVRMAAKADDLFKVLIVGNAGVMNLPPLLRLTEDMFSDSYISASTSGSKRSSSKASHSSSRPGISPGTSVSK